MPTTPEISCTTLSSTATAVEVAVAQPAVKSEEKRLASYSGWQVPEGVFVTKLAHQGYFHHPSSDEITCFCCGRPYGNGHLPDCQDARQKLNVPFHQCLLPPQCRKMTGTTTTTSRVVGDSNPGSVNRQGETDDQRETTISRNVLCISGITDDIPLPDSNPGSVDGQGETDDQRETTTSRNVLCVSGSTDDNPLPGNTTE